MVSGYYNPLQYQKHTSAYPPGNHWFPNNYPTPHPQQFLNEVHEAQAALYYNQHTTHMFQSGDWHAPETMQSPPTSHHGSSHHMLAYQPSNAPNGQTHLNETTSSNGDSNHNNSHPTPNLTEALPSPPITVSGSELSSPGGAPVAASSPNGNIAGSNGRATPTDKAVYFDWMKKPSYPAQPTPVSTNGDDTDSAVSYGRNGKTRTKDKYRVVYSDYQRLELEKEYCTSRYITIRRKSELATSLQLSERQVKIWFQNRRAKERKQQKKRDDPAPMMGADYLDTKPKLEPGAHQHLLHQMQMHMAIPPMGLHHPGLHHPHPHALLQQSQHHNLHQLHAQMPGSVPTPPM